MKIIKTIIFGFFFTLLQSNIQASNYHIICVAGPHEEIKNDYLKQKIFLGLFKKLIKVRNQKAPRNSQVQFETFADKSFTNYNIESLSKSLLKKLQKSKNDNLILIAIGQGSQVIETSLDLFYQEDINKIRGWQQIVGIELINKLGIRIDEDDFNIVLNLLENLTLGFENQDLSHSYLEVDFEKINDQLEPLVKTYEELANQCCSPKTKKIIRHICSVMGVGGIIALLLLL